MFNVFERLRKIVQPQEKCYATITVDRPDFIRIEFAQSYPRNIEKYLDALKLFNPEITWLNLYKHTNVVLITVARHFDKKIIANAIAQDLENNYGIIVHKVF